ncbi:low molecular weight phosphatase family protein [Phenylobacterium sp.]|uniref:arsenate-mycothiol transferase ArsC n=1 Tax=Phenylobacterium sp. TaxID=1871053 RepID=UPI0027349617|nr:low molecular weight phosphatase family protein [Phenylobacterium sp.]MDP3854405.1 low molecular weight phosphatase family protein [Phenylobacterium sp.]
MVDDAVRAPLPGAVLFACNFNRVRSPMAEALLKRALGDRIYVDSCGLRREATETGERVDPFVQAVMAEISCDLVAHSSKTFDDLEDDSFDLVVSLTPEAQHRAVEMTRGRAAEIEYWPTFDPTLSDGSWATRMAAYREVRDALAARIAERFGR